MKSKSEIKIIWTQEVGILHNINSIKWHHFYTGRITIKINLKTNNTFLRIY